ncbi:response regulator [Qipengyuania soli]|uniref:Response regulator n=1 Tax=Qipengyuania soli TaxID=2782568 RepID=A0A7S8F3P9_9SPHN|nr:response regulator [Qipengyuania soli]QPC98515.1 response regulator [Qipengyuania soli]
MTTGPGRKIAIVENDEILAMLWKETCRAAGYEVVGIATSFSQACRLVTGASPDVVIADFALDDGRDGLELLHRVMSEQADLATILVTGWDLAVVQDRLAYVGPGAVLAKPVMPGELLDCLATLRTGAAQEEVDAVVWAHAA